MRNRFLRTSAAAALAALSGCASRPAAPTNSSPIESLSLAANAERSSPQPAAMAAPPPPGVEPILAQSIAADDTKAHVNLDEALVKLVFKSPTPAPREVEPDASQAALRLYVSGREKLLSGQAAAAMDDLKRATQLDPGAGAPWRELGEAQLVAGLRTEALASFRASTACGLRDARTLEILGRAALDRSDNSEAIAFLCAALSAEPERVDPALARVVLVQLARALSADGYTIAAKESLYRSLTASAQLSSSTRYAADLGAIFRRQGDLWRDVGDAECRLGNFDEAIEAYRNAIELPSIDNRPLRPRIVFACMRAGRPAAATAAVLEEIAGSRGRISPTNLSLLQYIATYAGNARQIADSLGAMRSRVPASPTIERETSLAQALLLPADRALPLLRRHLAAHPTDLRAAQRLIELSPDSAAAECTRLIASSPAATRQLAEAILQSSLDISAVSSAIDKSSPRNAARLLASTIAAKQGRPGQACDIVATISGGDALGIAAAQYQAEIAYEAGRPDALEAAIARVRASKLDAAPLALARALMPLQRYTDALAALRPALASQGPDRLDRLLLAGDLAARLALPDEAERYLNEAVALDPHDDRVLSLQFTVYNPSGVKPDAARLTQIVRELRLDNPENRTLRFLRAREMMRRSQWTPAENELTALATEDPGDPAPLELLLSTWQERFKTDSLAPARAEKWLSTQLQRRPQSALLLAGLASIRATQNRAGEIEPALRSALDAGAGPDTSRVLERALRENLSRAKEADDLALARLKGRTLFPAEALELASIAARNKDFPAALQALKSGLPPEVSLNRDQTTVILGIINDASAAMLDAKDTGALADIAALFDRCIAAGTTLTAELHMKRLAAMAAAPSFSADQLVEATRRALADFPALKARPYIIVTQMLVAAERSALAPDYIARSIAGSSQIDVDLYQQWFIVTARFGKSADARAMIDAIHSAGKLQTLLERVDTGENVASSNPRSQAAYVLGVLFAQLNKPDEAEAAYELALSYDPRHAWACNNLGYSLADRGVQIERASSLLEQAIERLPDQTPVLDSLGWLRYKQAILLDITDAETGLTKKRGALYFLQKAVNTPVGQEDPTILDHYGDALWLAGKPDDAIRSWEAAARVCRDLIQRDNLLRQAAAQDADPPAAPVEDSAAVVEARKIIDATRQKQTAAASNQPVPVAAQYDNPNPLPPKDAPKPQQQAAPQPAPDRARPD